MNGQFTHSPLIKRYLKIISNISYAKLLDLKRFAYELGINILASLIRSGTLKSDNEAKGNNEIITKIDNMTKNSSLDLMYFNMIFTEREVVLDFLNRSFRSWILRIKPYKELKYDGIDISTIKKRHNENIVIKYDDIKKIRFNKRTFIKNAYIEFHTNGSDKGLRLFSRYKIDLEEHYLLLKDLLLDKIEIN